MTEEKSILNLFGKLLNEKTTTKKKIWELQYESLITSLNNNDDKNTNSFFEKIEKSTYPAKNELIGNFEKELKKLDVLYNFPELVGKTVIGILIENQDIYKNICKIISPRQDSNIFSQPVIPTIFHADFTNNKIIEAVTKYDDRIQLDLDEFHYINSDFNLHGIDPNDLLKGLSIQIKTNFENIVFVLLPEISQKFDYYIRDNYYYELMNLFDHVILTTKDFGYEKWANYFSKRCTLNFITDESHAKSICSLYKSQNNDIFVQNKRNDYNNLKVRFRAHNLIRNNVLFTPNYLYLFSKIRLYFNNKIREGKENLKYLSNDIIMNEDENSRKVFQNIKKGIVEKIDHYESDMLSIAKSEEFFIHQLKEFEESLANFFNLTITKNNSGSSADTRSDLTNTCFSLVLNLIESGFIKDTEKIMEEYDSILSNKSYRFIVEMYKTNESGQEINYCDLNNLNSLSNDFEFIIRAKLKFRNELNLPTEKIKQYAEKLNDTYDPEIYRLLGEYYEVTNYPKAEDYYYKAVKSGDREAAEMLFNLRLKSKKDRKKEIFKEFADLLVPEAAFEYGKYLLNEEVGYYHFGLFYIRIAAAFEHIDAIIFFAEKEYTQYINDNNFEAKVRAYKLYLFLYREKGIKDNDLIERLGILSYEMRKYREARMFLSKCNTKNAFYYRGLIYRDGNGITSNRDKAKELFYLASEKGHQKAQQEYNSILNNEPNNYLTDDEPYEYEELISETDSRCFLTTATCLALGKKDNCKEILAYKKYRDEVLINDADGEKLISDYYRIAPIIVTEIEKKQNKKSIYMEMYDNYISKGYDFLLQEDYTSAKQTYIALVKDLAEKYL